MTQRSTWSSRGSATIALHLQAVRRQWFLKVNPLHATYLGELPEPRPFSQEQLVAEVKSIYAGITMVESKCMQANHAHNSHTGTDTNIITLARTWTRAYGLISCLSMRLFPMDTTTSSPA